MPIPAMPPVTSAASIVVKWNTARAAAAPAVAHATLIAIEGSRVTVRLGDGTSRSYTAAPNELQALRALVGKTIAFRLR